MENSKNMEKNNMERWKAVINEHVMLYPNERVVQFMGRKFQDRDKNSNMSALDIGFGSGRHLKLLLDYGFQTYGIDYVEDCKTVAETIFSGNKNLKDLIVDDIARYDFKDQKFDLLMVFGIIFLRTEEDIKNDLKKLNSILKKDGRMFISFRTKSSSFYKTGKQISDNTFIIDHKGYENATYTFFDKDEVEKILDETGFEIDYIEREDYWKNNLAEHHSWWLVSATKK